MVFFSLANHGICQEQLPEPNKQELDITDVSDKNEFESIISSDRNNLLCAQYCAGTGDNGIISVVLQENYKVYVYLSHNDNTMLFGSMTIKEISNTFPAHKLQPFYNALEEYFFVYFGDNVPEHITITHYLERFKKEHESNKYRLEDITPAFVYSWIDDKHKQDPRMFFAVRMKMIIVLAEKTFAENPEKIRATQILGECTQELFANHSMDMGVFLEIPNIEDIITICSQMFPHIVFMPKTNNPFDNVLAKFHQAFFQDKLNNLEHQKPYYPNDNLFNANMQSIQSEKELVADFITNLSGNTSIKDAFNRIINAMHDILINMHTISPNADRKTTEAE
ncbi:MAG: hypothetical protein COY39_02440 [Alphaproteobacteria bacterium CG_4_10_14_0_8_um_filter_37_21]|nr:MAG: hypothetical protein COY39_02440 [Alphaproteobacteria bacterium CG_4_10_14_0_8_um_filter_37_21]